MNLPSIRRSQVVLSEKLAGQLGLKPLTSTIMHGVGGGGKIDTKLYSVDEVSIGDVKIKKVPVERSTILL